MNRFIGAIKEIDWNKGPNRAYFKGYALLENINIDKDNKVKKSLIISNGKKKFFIPVQNLFDESITNELGNGSVNYNYAGFKGYIDLGYINDMSPISDGKWSIKLYINADGVEREVDIPYEGERYELDAKKLKSENSYKVYNTCLLYTSDAADD